MDCPENTFSPTAGNDRERSKNNNDFSLNSKKMCFNFSFFFLGSAECIPCGPNTYTPAGSAKCTDLCGFTAKSKNDSIPVIRNDKWKKDMKEEWKKKKEQLGVKEEEEK